jgi:hypothetical protein
MARPTVKEDVENQRSEQQRAVTDEQRYRWASWGVPMIDDCEANGRDDRSNHDRGRDDRGSRRFERRRHAPRSRFPSSDPSHLAATRCLQVLASILAM